MAGKNLAAVFSSSFSSSVSRQIRMASIFFLISSRRSPNGGPPRPWPGANSPSFPCRSSAGGGPGICLWAKAGMPVIASAIVNMSIFIIFIRYLLLSILFTAPVLSAKILFLNGFLVELLPRIVLLFFKHLVNPVQLLGA